LAQAQASTAVIMTTAPGTTQNQIELMAACVPRGHQVKRLLLEQASTPLQLIDISVCFATDKTTINDLTLKLELDCK
jgi:hypothetical protein